MKHLMIIPAILIASISVAQPALKIYAYSQTHTPGMIPAGDAKDENGKAITGGRSGLTFIVYVASPANNIDPKEIWLKDHWWAVLRSSIVKTPVYSEQPVRKLLVPSQKWKVIQLQIGDALPKKMGGEADLVLHYF